MLGRATGQIRSANRPRKQHITNKHNALISFVKHDVAGRVTGAVPHFELELADVILLTIDPIMIDWWRLFESKSVRRPLRARNADPRGLLGQCLVHEFVTVVQADLRVRLQFFQRRDAADMIEMRVRQRDCLQLETTPLEYLDDPIRLIAGIDADRLLCFFTTDDARVLLKVGDGDFFDNHWLCIILYAMPVSTQSAPLAAVLDSMTTEGAPELTEHLDAGALKCYACGHRCLIKAGKRGICKVRFNEGGHLRVPTNYVAALACDPTEKKPFFHVLPGSDTLTFGMLGCDLHCAYCQNWLTSQALRDDSAGTSPQIVSAERLVSMAKAYGAAMVGSSYNEPLITAEWAVDVFKRARPAGFRTAFISNGNATPQVLDYLRPWTDCYKIDLKSMNDKNYRQLGGVVDNILETVKMVHERGFWEEIVTLVIPGFNDSEDELRRAANFIASVSPDIPWHVTAFHQDYRMTENANTTAAQLIRACEIGREAGLNYIYAGNLPGRVGRWENTYCPSCDELLVERFGYLIRQVNVTGEGRCPTCATKIPGIWK